MIRFVAFDLDGTLVDSHRDIVDATNDLLVELGAAALPNETVTGFVGDGAAVLVGRALKKAGVTSDLHVALARFLVHYDSRLLATTVPYPQMMETIASIGRTKRMAVLTNKPGAPSVRILEGLGMLASFVEVIGGDSPHGRKPDPSGLLSLVSAAGVTPEETLLVGDSPVDLATARRAGTHICLARYGFGYRFDGTEFDGRELFIDGPAELVGVLERLDAPI